MHVEESQAEKEGRLRERWQGRWITVTIAVTPVTDLDSLCGDPGGPFLNPCKIALWSSKWTMG